MASVAEVNAVFDAVKAEIRNTEGAFYASLVSDADLVKVVTVAVHTLDTFRAKQSAGAKPVAKP